MQDLEAIITLTCHARFPMGRVVITANAEARIKPQAIVEALRRYSQCDWGDLCLEDIAQNEYGLENSSRLFAAYGKGKERLWIITEADRYVTTVLLPQDY